MIYIYWYSAFSHIQYFRYFQILAWLLQLNLKIAESAFLRRKGKLVSFSFISVIITGGI